MQELTLTKCLPGLEELGADLLVTTPQQRWLALSRPFICIIAFSVAAYLQWWWLAPIIVFLTFVVNVGIKRLMANFGAHCLLAPHKEKNMWESFFAETA